MREAVGCADSLAVLGPGWALQNSLHSLRSLRSIICCESDIDARCARPSPSLRSSAPLKSPWSPPRARAGGGVSRATESGGINDLASYPTLLILLLQFRADYPFLVGHSIQVCISRFLNKIGSTNGANVP
jgi:hypothetical protein